MRRSSLTCTAVGLAVAIAIQFGARAALAETPGKADYDQNCASCHGADGKGNGPALYTIPGIHPPDLTLLTTKNGGTFPKEEVTDAIDGRKQIPSHERLNMPFWGVTMQPEGQEFTPESDAKVKQRIAAVVSYVESIQQK
ncbi:MAG TPA: cytochrome c [Candidatus Binataceae bacterium]|nr:cytochrome c [Candidatus Binataceae bacterium]